jgi:lantibiotic modifying enzyme
MGVAVFFAYYASFCHEKRYEQIAVELLEEINSLLPRPYPIDYESGLSGIGVAIEYLAQQKLMQIDTDDFLEIFDNLLPAIIQADSVSKQTIIDVGKYFFIQIQKYRHLY